MIKKLTSEQEAKLPIYRDKWLEIGLATGDCNFEEAKKAACKAYACAGLDAPQKFYLFDSPLSASIGASLLYELTQTDDQIRSQVFNQVWSQVEDQIGDRVGYQVSDRVDNQITAPVRAPVLSQVRNQVRDRVSVQASVQVRAQVDDQVTAPVRAPVLSQIKDQVWSQVWDQGNAQARAQLSAQLYGAHDASWLSTYDFMQAEVNIDLREINGLIEIAKHTGWWTAYKKTVIFQHKPNYIKCDGQKRLHCEDGPSIEYRDGFSIFSWHGTQIPGEWVTDKDKLTPEIALTHKNMEKRRCACEILGWAKILKELKAISIDKNPNKMIGELLEVEIPDIGKEKFLRVMCGTNREFALPVPPEVTSAEEAQRWMNFVPEGVPSFPTIRT